MKLDEFHVEQFSAGVISERHTVAGVFPRVRGHTPSFANAAGRHYDRLRFEDDEAPGLAPISECSGDASCVGEQSRDRTLHEDVEPHLHAAILQRTDHLQPGAIADVAEAFECMSTEGALQNSSISRAIEQCAPLFELANALRSLLRMELRHPPVVHELAAAHRIAEVGTPI